MINQYEALTAQCRALHSELEGLTYLERMMGPTDEIKRRRAQVLELIEHNLDVQSCYWPSSPLELKKPEIVVAPPNLEKTFISNMKVLRKQKGLTQQSLANQLGINIKRIGSWEEWRAFPPIKALVKISDFFGKNLTDMLTKKYV